MGLKNFCFISDKSKANENNEKQTDIKKKDFN